MIETIEEKGIHFKTNPSFQNEFTLNVSANLYK